MSVRKLLDLAGRRALVTGGSRGLGLQMAEALGEMGARVALTARKPDELDQAVAHLASLGIEAVPLACDMSDAGDDRADGRGGRGEARPDRHPGQQCRNHLGRGRPSTIRSRHGRRCIDLNLTAMFVTSQEVGRRCMVPRRQGKVINIASILGLVGGGDPGRPGDHRVQHEQGRRGQLHALARRGMGAATTST